MVTNLGHHGHMTWYILNVLNNNQFVMVLVPRPRPYNVLAMYQVSASPLTPSEYSQNPITA